MQGLPDYAYATNAQGVVIRVFHKFARTEFEPTEQVAQALRASVRGADQVEVRGHTDSAVVNPIDKLIAIERAEKARLWLIDNGVESSKIRTKYFSQIDWNSAFASLVVGYFLKMVVADNLKDQTFWVTFPYFRDMHSITLRVIDQGNGFDWQSFLEIDPERAFDPNGRGIALARLLSFSTLIYEGGGNTAVATISLAENNH